MPIHTLKTFRSDAVLALLDIEGTTSSVRFSQQVLLPYAWSHTPEYLTEFWDHPVVQELADQLLHEASGPSLAALREQARSQYEVIKPVVDATRILISQDSRAACLKALQRMIWNRGYDFGELKSHVFPDVPHALVLWYHQGVRVRVFSHGSVESQRTFFAHTAAGNLLPVFEGHHDSDTGGKREADSYRKIAQDAGLEPRKILFFSDVPEELDAAQAAGLQTVLTVRPDNPTVGSGCHHPRIKSLLQVSFSGPR